MVGDGHQPNSRSLDTISAIQGFSIKAAMTITFDPSTYEALVMTWLHPLEKPEAYATFGMRPMYSTGETGGSVA